MDFKAGMHCTVLYGKIIMTSFKNFEQCLLYYKILLFLTCCFLSMVMSFKWSCWDSQLILGKLRRHKGLPAVLQAHTFASK